MFVERRRFYLIDYKVGLFLLFFLIKNRENTEKDEFCNDLLLDRELGNVFIISALSLSLVKMADITYKSRIDTIQDHNIPTM